jgi:hypothetical protein
MRSGRKDRSVHLRPALPYYPFHAPREATSSFRKTPAKGSTSISGEEKAMIGRTCSTCDRVNIGKVSSWPHYFLLTLVAMIA